MMRPLQLAACIAIATLPIAASAQDPEAGSIENGRMLTYTCQGCHGVANYRNAYPNYRVPRIVGQSSQYLTNALVEYRSGNRKHPTMQAQAVTFSDQDIADITAYLSSQQQ